MAQVRFSVEAETDIDEIAAFSARTFGWRQADIYLRRLEECLELLAENPSVGRECAWVKAGMRRFEIGRHTIFYLPEPKGILIARILHQQMLPTNYLQM